MMMGAGAGAGAGVPGITLPFDERFISLVNGELADGATVIAIAQLVLSGNGLAVVASDTESSDRVLNDLVRFLDDTFGFRIGSLPSRRDHISNLVFEIDDGFEAHMDAIARMAEIISQSVQSEGKPFHLKRLAFGRDFGVETPIVVGLDAIERVDFLIERRQNEPYSRNRYYSSAPLTTQEHFAVLEKIDQAIRQAHR